jgi:hypothetical protein
LTPWAQAESTPPGNRGPEAVPFWGPAASRTGHLWRNRCDSCLMDEHHFRAVLRSVERNPVRSGLTADRA